MMHLEKSDRRLEVAVARMNEIKKGINEWRLKEMIN
jgi:hypothetical protein